jgi:hypothetical protein
VNIVKVRFWAIVMGGRVTIDQEYKRDFYRDDNHFYNVIEFDLEKWASQYPLDDETEEKYGWKKI